MHPGKRIQVQSNKGSLVSYIFQGTIKQAKQFSSKRALKEAYPILPIPIAAMLLVFIMIAGSCFSRLQTEKLWGQRKIMGQIYCLSVITEIQSFFFFLQQARPDCYKPLCNFYNSENADSDNFLSILVA